MAVSTLRRARRRRAGIAVLAAVMAVAGQIAATALARAVIQTRPPLAYVFDTGLGAEAGTADIKVLDPATDTVVATLKPFQDPAENPRAMALSSDGTTLYTQGLGGVAAIDTSSQSVKATLAVSSPYAVFATDPAAPELYVSQAGQLSVVDTHSNAVVTTIPMPGDPTSISFDPAAGQLYAVEPALSGDKITVIDTKTETVIRTITTVDNPAGFAFTKDGSRAYIGDYLHNTVRVLDTATGTVVSTITVGEDPGALALTPSGAKLYVDDADNSTVSVIDTATGTVTGTIPGFQRASGAYVSPDGTKAYISDSEADTVRVIDTATDTVSGTIPVGNAPGPIAAYNGSGTQCPCSVFPAFSTPGGVDSGDPYSVVVGVKVSPSVAGWISGVRFYKSSLNTGTHTGSLWTSDGTLLATGTFTGETATGWQTLTFANPVPVKPGVTYVASYYAPDGHYSYDVGYFFNNPAGQAPITALGNSTSGGNGVFSYGGADAFPNSSYNGANYWVDVVFDNANVPTAPPTVTGTTPGAGARGVAATAAVSATFSAPVDSATVHFSVTDAAGGQVPGTVGFNAGATTVTFTPGTQLPVGTVFTASVQATDGWGNAMSAPVTWTFTTDTAPPSYQCPCSLFGTGTPPGVVDSNDPNSVELGVSFTPAVNGTVTGIRFYKGASATGVHTGTLWRADTGTTLETGTFTNETASGWQTLAFDRPWPVTAGNTYYASYHAPAGHYSYTPGYFSYAHQSYPLIAPANVRPAGNGLYGYGSGPAPMGYSSDGTSYWVDVVFVTP